MVAVMVVVTEADTVVVMEAMEVAMEDMDMVRKREMLMPSPKPMRQQKLMPIMDMEAMEADMVMVDTEDTAMDVNADQLNPATDMVATEEAMVVTEAMVDMVAMVVTEDTVAMGMVDMDIMDKTDWNSYHSVKELDT